jgi:hypothetical protein
MSPLLSNPSLGQWDGPKISLSHLNSRLLIDPHTESPWALNHHSARSTDYHYILASDDSEELYDHTNDPNEWTNQASNTAYAAIKADLKLQLFRALGFKNSQSLVSNGDFESGTTNWANFGPVTLSNNTAHTYKGSHSLLISDRTTGTWNGARQDLLSTLEPGKTYNFSVWVKLANSSTDTVRLNIKQVIGTDPTQFINLGTVTANNADFSLIEGDYTVPYGVNINELELTLNGPAIGVNFYIDHVRSFEYQTSNVVASMTTNNQDGSISINWNAELGVSYRLEQTLDLTESWTVLQSDISADKSNMTWLLSEQPTGPRAFWRVVKN